MFVNPFEQQGNWYKANFHTHTTASDGQSSPEERARQYRERGYSVLAITDHGITCDVSGLGSADFLVIGGTEVSVSPSAEGTFYHLVCLPVPCGETVPSASEPQDVIAWAKQAGGETFIAHPYWTGNDTGDLLRLQGHAGIEVFNATCQSIGKGSSSVHWDYLLGNGLRAPAIAVDDAHGRPGSRDVFGGWTLLKMNELSERAVLEALRTGCCYSSTGAEILDFRVVAGKVHLSCSPAREIHLMAASWHGCSRYADGRDLLTEASADLSADWKYVRAEVVGPAGECAWSNPVYL